MKIKIFVIVAAIAALMSPLVASADAIPAIPFANLSTVYYGILGTAKPAKFTVIDLNSATTKVKQAYKLTNGVIDTESSAAFIFDKNSTPALPMQGLKISIDEIIDYYADINQIQLVGQAHLKSTMLRTGPKTKSSSGPGTVEIDIPDSNSFNNEFANFTGVTSKPAKTVTQTIMTGAAKFIINVKPDMSSAVLTVGAIKPAFATIQTVTKRYSGTTTFGNTSGIITIENSTQNLNASGAVLPGETISSFTQVFP
jgi:hypothetical protein